MSLYGVIGENNPTYLLADPIGADKIAIPCEPGNGTVKRGTLMYRKSGGLWAPATSSEATTSYMLVVLDEEVNTDANLAVAEDAAAYRAGRFVRGKVTLANDGEVTAAIELVLRQMNIVFDPMVSTEAFDNARYAITYKANNGATPAEEDYVAYKDAGAAHTVLANSVTNFTAPATKSFSKWNTKADGSGTDYAAAASYTTDADLTLYAVWA